jgi:hypothetical protein
MIAFPSRAELDPSTTSLIQPRRALNRSSVSLRSSSAAIGSKAIKFGQVALLPATHLTTDNDIVNQPIKTAPITRSDNMHGNLTNYAIHY